MNSQFHCHVPWKTGCVLPMIVINLSNLSYANYTTLMAENEEELKRTLMRMKEESEKAGLKLNIQKTKIMASGPIASWKIEGENREAVTDFIFLGSKITVGCDCSHEIKRCYLLESTAMTNQMMYQKTETLLCRRSPCSQSFGFSSSHVRM